MGWSRSEIKEGLEPTMKREGTFDVKLSDGTIVRFPWFRYGFAENELANNSEREIARDENGKALRRETNKGGVRLHTGVFSHEVYALALTMNPKIARAGDAIAGQFVMGAKGGIGAGKIIKAGTDYTGYEGRYLDPASPIFERKMMMTKFGESYGAKNVGLGKDVQAGDVNTKSNAMEALSKSYSKDGFSPGVSGKTLLSKADGSTDPRGGIAYRKDATGDGVWVSAKAAAKYQGLDVNKATVVAQGWGEVGRAFAMSAIKDGARVIAIQNLFYVNGETVAGMLEHPKGDNAPFKEAKDWAMKVDAYLTYAEKAKRKAIRDGKPIPKDVDLAHYKGGELAKGFTKDKDASEVRADIVGLNALGNVITTKTVKRYVKSGTTNGMRKILTEGANLAETKSGARRADRNADKLIVIPGVLANLAGVHVSDLELLQNSSGEVISSERAKASVESIITNGFNEAVELAKKQKISIRKAIERHAWHAARLRMAHTADAPRVDLETAVLGDQGPSVRETLAGRIGVQLEKLAALPRRISMTYDIRRAAKAGHFDSDGLVSSANGPYSPQANIFRRLLKKETRRAMIRKATAPLRRMFRPRATRAAAKR
jgi:glutamate dehydrogenase/leucine dehydrogenase